MLLPPGPPHRVSPPIPFQLSPESVGLPGYPLTLAYQVSAVLGISSLTEASQVAPAPVVVGPTWRLSCTFAFLFDYSFLKC